MCSGGVPRACVRAQESCRSVGDTQSAKPRAGVSVSVWWRAVQAEPGLRMCSQAPGAHLVWVEEGRDHVLDVHGFSGTRGGCCECE